MDGSADFCGGSAIADLDWLALVTAAEAIVPIHVRRSMVLLLILFYPNIVRLAALFLGIATGFAPLLVTYLVAWFVVPKGPPV
jgi:hypothetical protein